MLVTIKNRKMKNNTKQNQIIILLITILLVIPTCSSAQHVVPSDAPVNLEKRNDNRYGSTSHDSTCIPQRDYDIITGNHKEYRKFREYWMWEHDVQKLCDTQRERLLYAFIMAEIYRDTLAAFDFAQQIGFMGISCDSVLGAKVIEFWEMASKSTPDIVARTAAFELSRIYEKGLYGVRRNIEKSNYYSQLLRTIDDAIRRYRKKQ